MPDSIIDTVRFDLLTADSAPVDSRPILEGAREAFGFVPNLLGVLAHSPVARRAYTELSGIVEGGTLDAGERQVVLLTVSVANRCRYCVAAHTVLARQAGVAGETVEAIRDEAPVRDERVAALSRLARELVERRGWLGEDPVAQFLAVGFDRAQILEVIAAVALKTISNYANHLAETPEDGAFAAAAWVPVEER